MRVKELFEPIGLQKKPMGFCSFKHIFLRNQSLGNTWWFHSKKCKIGKGNLYLTENWYDKNKIWSVEDNDSYMCHICAKGF